MPAFGLAYLFREDELFTIYDKFTNFCSFPGNLAYFIEGYIDSIKKNSEKQIHVGKKHTKKEYPTNCIEDILFGFFSLFI